MKLFPGYILSHDYEPTVRPWYKKAATSVENKMEASAYRDIIWDRLIATVSKAIIIDGEVKMVLGIDFKVELLHQVLQNEYSQEFKIVCRIEILKCPNQN